MSFIRTSRRRFMQNAGLFAAGSAIGQLLLSTRARAQSGDALRALFMFTPHGAAWEYWKPKTVGGDWSIDYDRCTLSPLAPLKDKICVLDGLDFRVLYDGLLEDGQVYSGHEGGMSTFLTGSKPQYLGPGTYVARSRSIDQVLADHLVDQGTILPHRSLELAAGLPSGTVTNDTICYGYGEGEAKRIPGTYDPSVVYTRLFGSFQAQAQTPSEMVDLLGRKQSVLDYARHEITRLKPQLTSFEKEKLEQHLEGIRQIETRIGEMVGTTSVMTTECDGVINQNGLTINPLAVENLPMVLDLHGDILAEAFACDLVRVSTLQILMGGAYLPMPWLGIEVSPHQDLAHQIYDADRNLNTDAHVLDPYLDMQTWYAQMVANVLSKLDAIPDGNGKTILDNTIAVWGNEMGDSTVHSNVNVPFVIAGGGGIEMGRWLEYSQSRSSSCATYQGECQGDYDNAYQYLEPHNRLWVSVCQQFGMQIDTFGDAKYTGPLPGL